MSDTPQRIAKVEFFPIRIPYSRPMQWASIAEDAARYGLVRLTTEDGIEGVAEGTVKPTWTGATLRSLGVVFEELFAPTLAGLDVMDDAMVRTLWRPRDHALAKAMIDVAIWDIRSQVAGKALWRMWDGEPAPEVSWVVTRQAPAAMAREAEGVVTDHGVATLKVKGGQGVETDLEALSAIRRAVGDDVRIYVDPNKDYAIADTPDYCKRIAEYGVVMVEDPCPLQPDAAFTRLQEACVIPLLVDNTCRSLEASRLFVERGAKAFNLKLQKARGYSENWQIVRHAHEHGCDVNIGLFGEASLGSLAALQISSALPKLKHDLPAEVTMFLLLPDDFVHEPPKVEGGRIRLPEEPGMAQFVDWDKVARLAP